VRVDLRHHRHHRLRLLPHILSFLQEPYCGWRPATAKFYITSRWTDPPFRSRSPLRGLFLASPVLLWEFWRFITPGSSRTRKRYAIPSWCLHHLFALGCAVGLLSLPHASSGSTASGARASTRIYDPINYLGLILLLMVVFGITFEFPVVLGPWSGRRPLPEEACSSWRRWPIVGIVVVARGGDPRAPTRSR